MLGYFSKEVLPTATIGSRNHPVLRFLAQEPAGEPRGSPSRQTVGSNCVTWANYMSGNRNEMERVRLDKVTRTWRLVRRGETLYRCGDAFQSIYALRSGSFKTVMSHQRSGCVHVSGFFLTGDTLGLDGICSESHACDAIALEDSSVCVIPFDLLEALCREMDSLQQHVHRILSREIVRESEVILILASLRAEQRVATFLLNISMRQRARGYSPSELMLRMTREEIGSYLGIKLETVSRHLSRFQHKGLISVDGKRVTLLDLTALDRILATTSARGV